MSAETKGQTERRVVDYAFKALVAVAAWLAATQIMQFKEDFRELKLEVKAINYNTERLSFELIHLKDEVEENKKQIDKLQNK